MPIPLIVPMAIGLGLSFNEMLGAQKSKKEKKAKSQSSLDRLGALMAGGSLGPQQAGPPTPERLQSGFTPREQQQLEIVAQSGPEGGAQAVALAEKFQLERRAATQQQFANKLASDDLTLRQQTGKRQQSEFDFTVQSALDAKTEKGQIEADSQRALVDTQFAMDQAADALDEGGDGSFAVFQPSRDAFGKAWLAGTPEFDAAEGGLVGSTRMLTDITELREIVRLVDLTGDIGTLATRRVQSLTTALQLQFKNLAGLGVISETDFTEFILKIVPDATTVREAILSNPQAIDQALVQFTVDALRANEDALRATEAWPTITDGQRLEAGQARKKAEAQNQVAGRELATEIEQTNRRQAIQERTGVGKSTLDEQLLGRSAFLRTVFDESGDPLGRIEEARRLGADPGLVPEGLMGVLAGGLLDSSQGLLKFLATVGGGRIAAGGARSR